MSVPSKVVLSIALTALLVLAVAGHAGISGPVLWGFGDSTHGVHLADLFAVALWGLGLVVTWRT